MSFFVFRRIFIGIRVVSDLILIPIVYILAYSLKFKVGWVFQNVFSLEFGQIYVHAQVEPYIQVSGIITILWLLGLYVSRVYKSYSGIMPEIDELTKVIKGVSLATLEVMIVIFIFDVPLECCPNLGS